MLMLLAILMLVFLPLSEAQANLLSAISTSWVPVIPDGFGFWVMLGFFIAFATKLTHRPISQLVARCSLAGSNTGVRDPGGHPAKDRCLRLDSFHHSIVPGSHLQTFAPTAMLMGVISILYTAKVAFAQNDLKRLIAYTSVSHMGFVLLGVYAWTAQGVQGAVMTMLAHGFQRRGTVYAGRWFAASYSHQANG